MREDLDANINVAQKTTCLSVKPQNLRLAAAIERGGPVFIQMPYNWVHRIYRSVAIRFSELSNWSGENERVGRGGGGGEQDWKETGLNGQIWEL